MKTEWLRRCRIPILVALDLVVLTVAVICAFVIRLDVEKVRGYHQHIGLLVVLVLTIRPPLFHIFGLYRRVWWYVDRRVLLNLALAILLGSILIVAVTMGLITPFGLFLPFPRSLFVFEPLLSGLFVGAVRLALRIRGERAATRRADKAAREVQRLGFADEVDVLAEARVFLHRVRRADFDVWVVPNLAIGGQKVLADESWREEVDRLFTAALSLYGLRRFRTAERVFEMLFEALIEGEERAVLPAPHPQKALQTNLDEAKRCYFQSLFYGWPWEAFLDKAVKASWSYREIGQARFCLAEVLVAHPQALKRVAGSSRRSLVGRQLGLLLVDGDGLVDIEHQSPEQRAYLEELVRRLLGHRGEVRN